MVFAILKATEERQDPEPESGGTDPRIWIRIRIKTLLVRNTSGVSGQTFVSDSLIEINHPDQSVVSKP